MIMNIGTIPISSVSSSMRRMNGFAIRALKMLNNVWHKLQKRMKGNASTLISGFISVLIGYLANIIILHGNKKLSGY